MSKPNAPVYQYDAIRIAEVIWVDAEEIGDIGWNELTSILREAQKPCPVMHTVGFVVHEDDEQICLLSTMGPKECSRLEKIPKGWVKQINVMRKGNSLSEETKKRKKRT